MKLTERTDAQVEDPSGQVIYDQKNKADGRFSFNTKVGGEYKTCFMAPDISTSRKTKISLDWKTGVAATDWDAIAKKENLDAMALELMRLEETIKEVYDQMLLMKKREAEMRDLNEATNSRVAWFSVFSLLVCITVAGWQLWYLKRFFERKKVL